MSLLEKNSDNVLINALLSSAFVPCHIKGNEKILFCVAWYYMTLNVIVRHVQSY